MDQDFQEDNVYSLSPHRWANGAPISNGLDLVLDATRSITDYAIQAICHFWPHIAEVSNMKASNPPSITIPYESPAQTYTQLTYAWNNTHATAMRTLNDLNAKPELFHMDQDDVPVWYLSDSYVTKAIESIAYFGTFLPNANWTAEARSQYVPNYFLPYLYLTKTNGTFYGPGTTLNQRAMTILTHSNSLSADWAGTRYGAWLRAQNGQANYGNVAITVEQEAAWAEVERFRVYQTPEF